VRALGPVARPGSVARATGTSAGPAPGRSSERSSDSRSAIAARPVVTAERRSLPSRRTDDVTSAWTRSGV
jgi:hypothetical protein